MTKKQTIHTGKRIWQQAKPTQPAQVHELKITLCGSKPPIWRHVAVPCDMRLGDLHWVIQIVMGWTNSHLHQFTVPNTRPKPTKEELRSLDWQARYERLTMYRDHCWSDPRMEVEGAEDERKVSLNKLAPAVKCKFIYEYDFGDGWEHEIKVVKISLPAEGVNYPVCLEGKLASPPEDCGGIWGYYEKLAILKDPKHEDYEDTLEWMGDDFDPERFDLDKINANLATFQRGTRRRALSPL